jgi:hypothetical protein
VNGAVSSFVVLLLLSSCGSSPVVSRAAPTSDQITLAPGQTVRLSGQNLSLTFQGVSGDSRCPVDVTCVWEGDAVVVVTVIEGDQAVRHELHTSGRFSPEAEAGGYRVRLVELAPVPRQGVSPAPGDYRATLAVTRK